MKKLFFPLLILAMFTLQGCELVGDIFKAGVWVGILIVIGIIALIVFLISKVSGKR